MNKGNYIVTTPTLQDIDRLSLLLCALFDFEAEFTPNSELQKNALKTIISNPSIGQIFVVKENETIVATVQILYTYSTALGAKAAILEDLIVVPEHRGKGIAKKLLSHVLQYCKENDIKRVTLLTDNTNKNAQMLYEKFGFKNSSMAVMRNFL